MLFCMQIRLSYVVITICIIKKNYLKLSLNNNTNHNSFTMIMAEL